MDTSAPVRTEAAKTETRRRYRSNTQATFKTAAFDRSAKATRRSGELPGARSHRGIPYTLGA